MLLQYFGAVAQHATWLRTHCGIRPNAHAAQRTPIGLKLKSDYSERRWKGVVRSKNLRSFCMASQLKQRLQSSSPHICRRPPRLRWMLWTPHHL